MIAGLEAELHPRLSLELGAGWDGEQASAGIGFTFRPPWDYGPPATLGECQEDADCPLGRVCETLVMDDCDSPMRQCIPGCRAGQRGCAQGAECLSVTCETCPCADVCEPPPQACGSRGLPPCPDGQYCRFPESAACGSFDLPGTCEPVPEDCPTTENPVCGCDGQVYDNACLAAQEGVSPGPAGACGDACEADPDLLPQGSFEDGEFGDWVFRYRKTGGLWWKRNLPSGHPEPLVLATGDSELPESVEPYCGERMLRLNDLEGQKHVTCAERTLTLDRALPCGGRLRVRWGATLEDPGHKRSDQPYVDIRLGKNGKVVDSFAANASDAASGGWRDLRPPGPGTPLWYRDGDLVLDIPPSEPGDTFEIRATVADCAEGGHGGAAFLDCLEIVDTCSEHCPSDAQGPTPDPIVPNVFTPNGDGINDSWEAAGVAGICSVEVYLYDRWGVRVAKRQISEPGGFSGPRVTLWNGQRGSGPAPESGNPYYYILRFSNCRGEHEETGFVYLFRDERCKAEVTSGEHTYRRKGRAERKAKRDWRRKVKQQHGREWSKWRRAENRRFDCSKSGKKWTCRAKGKPCRR